MISLWFTPEEEKETEREREGFHSISIDDISNPLAINNMHKWVGEAVAIPSIGP